jgi:DNA (cytosine-5)-methyltransferase 1
VDGGRIACDAELFPLAEGVKGRVGLLKGYGNAINPIPASVFIEAAME